MYDGSFQVCVGSSPVRVGVGCLVSSWSSVPGLLPWRLQFFSTFLKSPRVNCYVYWWACNLQLETSMQEFDSSKVYEIAINCSRKNQVKEYIFFSASFSN